MPREKPSDASRQQAPRTQERFEQKDGEPHRKKKKKKKKEPSGEMMHVKQIFNGLIDSKGRERWGKEVSEATKKNLVA